jgi:hypothetical protein
VATWSWLTEAAFSQSAQRKECSTASASEPACRNDASSKSALPPEVSEARDGQHHDLILDLA